MSDIVPNLLKNTKIDINNAINKSEIVQKLLKALSDGEADYKHANDYALEIGKALSKALGKNVNVDILPDGKMYYNIADRYVGALLDESTLKVSEYCKEVQTNINKKGGYYLNGKKPQINKDKRDGIINKLALANNFDDVSYMLNEPVINYIISTVSDSIEANAKFLNDAGVDGYIERTYVNGCCDWCKALEGKYEYPDVPKNIYKRHLFCRCNVLYKLRNRVTDVWSKESFNDKRMLIEYQEKKNNERDFINIQKARARANAKAKRN